MLLYIGLETEVFSLELFDEAGLLHDCIVSWIDLDNDLHVDDHDVLLPALPDMLMIMMCCLELCISISCVLSWIGPTAEAIARALQSQHSRLSSQHSVAVFTARALRQIRVTQHTPPPATLPSWLYVCTIR